MIRVVDNVVEDRNNGTKAYIGASDVSVRHVDARLLPFLPNAVRQAMWGIL